MTSGKITWNPNYIFLEHLLPDLVKKERILLDKTNLLPIINK
jgi:hypothetical protein